MMSSCSLASSARTGASSSSASSPSRISRRRPRPRRSTSSSTPPARTRPTLLSGAIRSFTCFAAGRSTLDVKTFIRSTNTANGAGRSARRHVSFWIISRRDRKKTLFCRAICRPRRARGEPSTGQAAEGRFELLRQPQKGVHVTLVFHVALRGRIDQLLAVVRWRLAELQVTLGVGGQDDLARGLGRTGDAAQAIVEARRTAGVVAAHDHRPDDEVMGGQPEILDALASMARALHRQPPLRESEVAVIDRKSTRLNSSHLGISYAVF